MSGLNGSSHSASVAGRRVTTVGSRVVSEHKQWFTKHVRTGRPGSSGHCAVPPYSERATNQYAHPILGVYEAVEFRGGVGGAVKSRTRTRGVEREAPCARPLLHPDAQVPHCEQHDDGLYKPENGRVDFVRQRELKGSEDARQELEESQQSEQLHQSHAAPNYARVLRRHEHCEGGRERGCCS